MGGVVGGRNRQLYLSNNEIKIINILKIKNSSKEKIVKEVNKVRLKNND